MVQFAPCISWNNFAATFPFNAPATHEPIESAITGGYPPDGYNYSDDWYVDRLDGGGGLVPIRGGTIDGLYCDDWPCNPGDVYVRANCIVYQGPSNVVTATTPLMYVGHYEPVCNSGRTMAPRPKSPSGKDSLEMNSISNAKPIELYPNPASKTVKIHIADNVHNSIIKIYAVSGNLVRTITPVSPITEIDISSYPKGLYTVQIISGNLITSKKLVKN